MSRDPRVDAYIEKSADFAKPILSHIREAIHAAWPAAEETIKWGMPNFTYNGAILANMAAFKAHATMGFWRAKDVLGATETERSAMGDFGRLTSVDDLPEPDVMAEMVRKAAHAIEGGRAPRQLKSEPRAKHAMPEELATALAGHAAANATFQSFPPSGQYEYVEWVAEAKRPETRDKRIAQALEWLAEGKRRNWKYENC
jgi:uncharacterized protein YdeI (YjbR/CyaY-like superfamily)